MSGFTGKGGKTKGSGGGKGSKAKGASNEGQGGKVWTCFRYFDLRPVFEFPNSLACCLLQQGVAGHMPRSAQLCLFY